MVQQFLLQKINCFAKVMLIMDNLTAKKAAFNFQTSNMLVASKITYLMVMEYKQLRSQNLKELIEWGKG